MREHARFETLPILLYFLVTVNTFISLNLLRNQKYNKTNDHTNERTRHHL